MCYLLILFLLFIPQTQANAKIIKGIYGLPAFSQKAPSEYINQLNSADINVVFVPEDRKTIRYYKQKGFTVLISVNVFGGRNSWEKYPDSIPITLDGQAIGSEKNDDKITGICPSHKKWRSDRLNYIKEIVNKYDIDGIFLDFIRYPGLWEVKEPHIPDTCYCKNCISQFLKEEKIHYPAKIKENELGKWIHDNYLFEWMEWKKNQITGFVSQVKNILKTKNPQLVLGLFIVPWAKGDHNNDISYKLGQDYLKLSRIADILSPMLYHKMCGKKEKWVGEMTHYFKSASFCKVLPIVQCQDCDAETMNKTIKYAGQAGADGILVYSFSKMQQDKWNVYGAFEKNMNLINNPEFSKLKDRAYPLGWYPESSETRSNKSVFMLKTSNNFKNIKENEIEKFNTIGINAGRDRSGIWYGSMTGCKPGKEYVCRGLLYRDFSPNGIYANINFWGYDYPVNTHRLSRRFQPFEFTITCPKVLNSTNFSFENNNPGYEFWLAKPSVTQSYKSNFKDKITVNRKYLFENIFPIGIYGGKLKNLEKIKLLGFNTLILSGNSKELEQGMDKCNELNLKYVISTPRNPDKLTFFLQKISRYKNIKNPSFYVNDEPGIYSFSINDAEDNYKQIKEKFPNSTTCMAIARPQVCKQYEYSSDFFMMDQYPVPTMPMTWLSDSIDQGADIVGNLRMMSVVQAFGGKGYGDWYRFPTWREMDCLAFLSIIHNSQGIFFYNFGSLLKAPKGMEKISNVIQRLNKIYPWLTVENYDQKIDVKMISENKFDPKGRPAVHCCIKQKIDSILLIAANSIGTFVEADILFGIKQRANIKNIILEEINNMIEKEFSDLSLEDIAEMKPEDFTATFDNIINLGKIIFNRSKKVKYEVSGIEYVKEVFSHKQYPVIEGGIRVNFKPYEAKVFLYEFK